eukprot:4040462-Amphidinium_carterae.1
MLNITYDARSCSLMPYGSRKRATVHWSYFSQLCRECGSAIPKRCVVVIHELAKYMQIISRFYIHFPCDAIKVMMPNGSLAQQVSIQQTYLTKISLCDECKYDWSLMCLKRLAYVPNLDPKPSRNGSSDDRENITFKKPAGDPSHHEIKMKPRVLPSPPTISHHLKEKRERSGWPVSTKS